MIPLSKTEKTLPPTPTLKEPKKKGTAKDKGKPTNMEHASFSRLKS